MIELFCSLGGRRRFGAPSSPPLSRATCGSNPDGLIIAVRCSKADPEAAGETVAVPFGAQAETCRVHALRAWLAVAGDDGAVFRGIDRHGNVGSNLTATAIASIVRARTAAAGILGDFADHSLRAGFATTAAHAGRSEASIMRHGRWKSVQVAAT